MLLVVSFFLYIAHRDSGTLHHGEGRSGKVVGFIAPSDWNPFDSGRLVILYAEDRQSKTARIWIDKDLADYRLGQPVQVFVKGDHVRTDLEPNGSAPLGLGAIGIALLGIGALGRGSWLLRRPPRDGDAAPSYIAGRNPGASDRMGSWLWWFGIPVFALFVTPLVVMDIGPAYEARTGGTPGTFVAREADCGGRGGCSYHGDFRSDDGTVTRTHIGMASGGDIHAVGDESRAVDTGDRANVYPPGGGSDWLIVTAFLVGIVGFTFAWGVSVLRRIRGRR